MPEGQVLEFSGITKRFGAVSAVADLTATVEPGRVTGFLGPNGAGKTTSLRILLGLVRPTSGTATIGGARYASLSHPLQTVGAVLEASSFHPGRTAADHLKVYAQAAGLPVVRVGETLGLVGLADVAGRKVGGFSLGMRQRLGLAYALLGDPGVLVLDEPANGLDPEGIKWMRGFLRQLAREGRTVFVSSHLLAEVQQTVDSVLIISQGRLVYQGALEDIADPSEFATVVDSPDRAALAAALRSADAPFELLRSGLTVRGLDPAAVGAVAASAGVALSSLQRRGPALEEVFLDLVSGVRVHPTAAAAGLGAAAGVPGTVAVEAEHAESASAPADEAEAEPPANGPDAETPPNGAEAAPDEEPADPIHEERPEEDAPSAIEPSPSPTFAVASTGVIDIVPFTAGDPQTDAYQDGLPLDEDPDVEALGAIDEELSAPDLPADPPDPVAGDRPWETYVKTDADVEADAFFASFTAKEAADAQAASDAEAAADAEAEKSGPAESGSDPGSDVDVPPEPASAEGEPPAEDERAAENEPADGSPRTAGSEPQDESTSEVAEDTSELGTLADLSPDWAEHDVHASRDDEGSEQR